MAANPLLRIRSHAKKTFGEAFGAATGVSDPSYRRTVAYAPLPSGHRYETTTQVSSLPDEGIRYDDGFRYLGPLEFLVPRPDRVSDTGAQQPCCQSHALTGHLLPAQGANPGNLFSLGG